ncbi:MAG TPA: choice-of-anchor tandem repeat GloVer-containing protein [Bryobacteraceae bacterium]|nr:choice-of-anchor tandem repeat GloVer-containing protein [Bryobacteraceae bacterium]
MPWKIAIPVLVCLSAAAAQQLTPIYDFQGGMDGSKPYAPLAADAAGVLYGTTEDGGGTGCGGLGCGAVFSWSSASGYSVLYRFQGGNDGWGPSSNNLLLGDSGAVYGTTSGGGGSGCQGADCGVVYALAPPSAAGGTPGCSGSGCGTLFELSPPTSGSGPWTKRTLYMFQGGADSAGPTYFLRAGSGNYYGVSLDGGVAACGQPGCGTVFELVPPSAAGQAWNEHVLYAFQGATAGDGRYPNSLTAYQDVLYGTATGGGSYRSDCANTTGCGVAFSLTPPPAGSSTWSEEVLYRFTPNWFGPEGNLVPDGSGGFYGAANTGQRAYYGVIYHLLPPATGTGWTAPTLHIFTNGSDGGLGNGLLAIGQVLYGTTSIGPMAPGCNCGTIYSFTP